MALTGPRSTLPGPSPLGTRPGSVYCRTSGAAGVRWLEKFSHHSSGSLVSKKGVMASALATTASSVSPALASASPSSSRANGAS